VFVPIRDHVNLRPAILIHVQRIVKDTGLPGVLVQKLVVVAHKHGVLWLPKVRQMVESAQTEVKLNPKIVILSVVSKIV